MKEEKREMAIIHGFLIPDDLYYLVEKHIWVRPMAAGRVQLGLTSVAYHLLHNSLVAISIRKQALGQTVERGRSIAMVESLKYNGALTAPFTGVLVAGNQALLTDPDLAVADPYGAGWIAEMQVADWSAAAQGLLTGEAALAAYDELLSRQKIAWAQ